MVASMTSLNARLYKGKEKRYVSGSCSHINPEQVGSQMSLFNHPHLHKSDSSVDASYYKSTKQSF